MYASKFTTFPSQIIKSIKAFLSGSLNARQQAEIRALIGAASDTGTDVIGDGTPVNGVAATATLNPAGNNNNIVATAKSTGTEGNLLSLQLAIDSTTDRTQLTVTQVSNAVVITSGDRYSLAISGTLTSNGTTPVVFPILRYVGNYGEGPYYPIYAAQSEEGTTFVSRASISSDWVMVRNGATWTTTDDVVTPDLVTTWTPQGAATGSPTVIISAATANQAITTLANYSSIPITAANAAANDGTGVIAAVAATPLTGGINQTLAPPYIRTGDGGLYVQEDGVWKKATLEAL